VLVAGMATEAEVHVSGWGWWVMPLAGVIDEAGVPGPWLQQLVCVLSMRLARGLGYRVGYPMGYCRATAVSLPLHPT